MEPPIYNPLAEVPIPDPMTEEKFEKKWGKNPDRDAMEDDELKRFISDCSLLYECTGFVEKFDSPYDDIGGGQHEHNGMPFKVIRRATVDDGVDLEAMPVWLVRFENGDEAFCYPEEITVLEHKKHTTK